MTFSYLLRYGLIIAVLHWPRSINGSSGKKKVAGSKKSSSYSPDNSDMVWILIVGNTEGTGSYWACIGETI